MLDTLKPRRNEAIARVRRNLAGLGFVLVATHLLPLPAPWTALRALWRAPAPTYSTLHPGALYRPASSWPASSSKQWAASAGASVVGGGVWWRSICFIELVVIGIMCLNVLQAAYALRYPPAPFAAPPTPAKPAPPTPKPSKSQRKLSEFPRSQSTPQPQKPFSSSTYAPSPISTPSRQLYYSLPADSSFNTSLNSSTASWSGSPVLGSPLAAYRGKHRTGAGRAFDGDDLSRLSQSVAYDDE